MTEHPHLPCEKCRGSWAFTQFLALVTLALSLILGGERGIAAAIAFLGCCVCIAGEFAGRNVRE